MNNRKKSIRKTDFKESKKKLVFFWREWRLTLILLLLILAAAFFLRYLKVMVGQQPVFADEAIYVRWSQIMKAEPTLRFLPLSDGKQPFYMWVLMFILRPAWDPLLTGRLLSSFFGVLSNLGIFILSYLFFRSKKVSLTASLMYAVSPFMLFFESMALVDSTLTMFGIWFFIFLYLTLCYNRFDLAMISGYFLGGALLTKSPALYFSILTPLTLSIFALQKNFIGIVPRILKGIVYIIPTLLIGYVIYNILRLGPNFQLISQRNADYVFPISQLWVNPKDPFVFHIKDIGDWIWQLGPGVLVFTLILGIIVGIKRFKKPTLLLLVWIFLPLFANAMYAKVFTARYILFVMPYIYILSSLFILFKTKYQKLPYIMLFLFTLNSFLVNYLFIKHIDQAPLPKSERTGYLEEWTAGYGIREVSDWLKKYHEEHPGQKIVVGTEGFFGTLPDGLQMYLNDYPDITVIGVGLDIKTLPEPLVKSKNFGDTTFLVINSSRLVGDPNSMGLELVKKFEKPLRTIGTHDYIRHGPRETLYFFEVI